MNPRHPWNSYRRVATQTASPGQLILMLFDGSIRFCNYALTGFSADDPGESIETIHNNVEKARAVVRELNSSLDMNAGGELAQHLRRVYEYTENRLLESNINKDAAGIQECLERLTLLRDAWSEMLQKQGQVLASPEPAMAMA